MLPFEDRYTRQRQVPGIGLGGQARIAAERVRLADDAAARIEREYLERAGVREFAAAPEAPLLFPHAAHFSDPRARSFAEGTHRALGELRRALGIGTPGAEEP